MTDPAEPVRYAFEFPDEACYPDGAGALSQDQKARRQTAGALNAWSAGLGIAAAVIAFIPGLVVVAPVLLVASVGLAIAGTAVTCSNSWGSDECSMDMAITIGGGLLAGAGAGMAKAVMPETATGIQRLFATGGQWAVIPAAICAKSYAVGGSCA